MRDQDHCVCSFPWNAVSDDVNQMLRASCHCRFAVVWCVTVMSSQQLLYCHIMQRRMRQTRLDCLRDLNDGRLGCSCEHVFQKNCIRCETGLSDRLHNVKIAAERDGKYLGKCGKELHLLPVFFPFCIPVVYFLYVFPRLMCSSCLPQPCMICTRDVQKVRSLI